MQHGKSIAFAYIYEPNLILLEFLWTHFYEWKIAGFKLKKKTDTHIKAKTMWYATECLLEIWNPYENPPHKEISGSN